MDFRAMLGRLIPTAAMVQIQGRVLLGLAYTYWFKFQGRVLLG